MQVRVIKIGFRGGISIPGSKTRVKYGADMAYGISPLFRKVLGIMIVELLGLEESTI